MLLRRSRWSVAAASVIAVAVVVAACQPVPPPSGGNRRGDQNGSLGTCPVFPSDNPWNTDISTLPVDANSTAYINRIQADGDDFLHADFGGGGAYGIPYVTVPGTEPRVPVNFWQYPGESDPGPYPVPLGAPIEGGSDRHVISVDRDNCMLYEMFDAAPAADHWEASNGATFNLRSNALRPAQWTSADAAGLPIFAGLARFDEVAAGEIRHALRVTFSLSQQAYIHPATHWASTDTTASRPPMGLRMRLSSTFDLSGYTGQALVILRALKRYGLIVADNGSNWFITGASDTRWDDTDLNQLKTVPGTAFEVVNTGERLHTPSNP